MPFQFTVSPDFGPNQLSGWHIFNTWLQRQMKTDIHFEAYYSFDGQRQAIAEDRIDIIYANPYDAAYLVREKGFVGVATPMKADETTIAVASESPVKKVEELSTGCRIAQTDDPDIAMMGRMMLEPANLDANNTETMMRDGYIQVAKALIQGEADVGFFLTEAFDELSDLVKNRLRILVSSDIQVLSHALLLAPGLAEHKERLQFQLVAMNDDDKGQQLLQSLGFGQWIAMEEEDIEFMIDLIDALAA